MSNVVTAMHAGIQVRGAGGDVFLECPFEESLVADVLAAEPWRTFRWHKGQMHFSGSYWSATEGRPVIYESLLELAWLLQADFDPAVSRIIAQPFLMTAHVDGRERRHIPDFLLLRANGPQVVDVKPASRLQRSEVAFTFAWSRQVVEARGWEYVVRSEPDPVRVANVRLLACGRRAWLFAPELVERMDDAVSDGMTLGDARPAPPPSASTPATHSPALLHSPRSARSPAAC
jgi:hypothetical protein